MFQDLTETAMGVEIGGTASMNSGKMNKMHQIDPRTTVQGKWMSVVENIKEDSMEFMLINLRTEKMSGG